ncbi:MAG: hypothetical protein QG674_60 [Patescibacteria group bacterium]|jgi:uncharacterized membrane protein|nr:hypothetical protein [Patescibacteria group bacterium]
MKKFLPGILNIIAAISAVISAAALSSIDSHFVNPGDRIKTINIFYTTFILTILLLIISRIIKKKNA